MLTVDHIIAIASLIIAFVIVTLLRNKYGYRDAQSFYRKMSKQCAKAVAKNPDDHEAWAKWGFALTKQADEKTCRGSGA